MRVTMTSSERTYPNGLDAAPLMARAGKTYDLPEAIAVDLVDRGKATAVDQLPEQATEPEPEAQAKTGPSRSRVAEPSETKAGD